MLRATHFSLSRVIEKLWWYAVSLCLCLLVLPLQSFAGTIEVDFIHSNELRKMELLQGRKANLEVHLKSSGDTVDGFRVSLIRKRDQALLKTIETSESGVVKFLAVPPGKYTVTLGIPRKLRGRTTVDIGDVLIFLHEPEVLEEESEAENEESAE